MRPASHRKAIRGSRRKSVARIAVPAGWNWHERAGLLVLHSTSLLRQHWVIHGFSTRIGGVSPLEKERVLNLGFTEWDAKDTVEKNRDMFQKAVAESEMQFVGVRQIHSDIAHRVDAVHVEPLKGDALISATPGLLLGIQTADCVPILLADPRNRSVGAVHAG